jgi:hypothetical protein
MICSSVKLVLSMSVILVVVDGLTTSSVARAGGVGKSLHRHTLGMVCKSQPHDGVI